MAEFFTSRLLRLLTVPYRAASPTSLRGLSTRSPTGSSARSSSKTSLSSSFLFQTMYDGFVERAKAVERLLADRRTTFMVVSTLEAVPVREAESFMGLLPERVSISAPWCSTRCCRPTCWTRLAERAARLSAEAGDLASTLCATAGPMAGADQGTGRRVLGGGRHQFQQHWCGRPTGGQPAVSSCPAPSVVASVPEFERTSTTCPACSTGPPYMVLGQASAVAGRVTAARGRRRTGGERWPRWPSSSGTEPTCRARCRAPATAGRRLGDPVRPVFRRPVAVRPRRPPGTTAALAGSTVAARTRSWSSGRSGRPPARRFISRTCSGGGTATVSGPCWPGHGRSGVLSRARYRSRHAASRPGWSASRFAWQGEVVAVLDPRVAADRSAGVPGELERVYVEVSSTAWPAWSLQATSRSPWTSRSSSEAPRVGDGVMMLDAAARVEFASPNAVNALHRLGVYSRHPWRQPRRAGPRALPGPGCLQTDCPGGRGARAGDVAVFIRCIPLLDQGKVTGALVLCATSPTSAGGTACSWEGRRHPRSPPPGEEQPADDLVATAVAGPAHADRAMPDTRWRKRSGGSAASPSSTRSSRGTRPTRSTSTTSCRLW